MKNDHAVASLAVVVADGALLADDEVRREVLEFLAPVSYSLTPAADAALADG
jgi:hypothetical protein